MIVYTIDRPYEDGVIEIYTVERGGGSYEVRTIERGEIIRDTARHGTVGMLYTSPAIALRDALNHDQPPRAASHKDRALDALVNLANELQGSPEGDRCADIIRHAMDVIDGYAAWPPDHD
ncbi:hypothetical protein [Halomonas aquatica]|uniref:Uncharacterized protein n=1 Tax=Halomonas aquatica TaxID=3151123 RepID=A0ABV1NI48_9GAMM